RGSKRPPRHINTLLRLDPPRHANGNVRRYQKYDPTPYGQAHHTTGSGRAPRPDLCA
ncbi:unnamed protein product, partial [Musa banksii]